VFKGSSIKQRKIIYF